MKKIVDLHTHSYYSDGKMSPEEILNIALGTNVGLLAITDHDMLTGSSELLNLSKYSDIKCLSGVEVDAVQFGLNIHILGYGVDLEDEVFVKFIKKNRQLLDDVNTMLIRKMEKDQPTVSMKEYVSYEHDRRSGGLKAIHYLIKKGFCEDLYEGFAIFDKYGVNHMSVDFPAIEEVCNQINKAGGKAVLAHPGRTFRSKSLYEFKEEIKHVITFGLDGIECYYPSHSKGVTEACLDICSNNNLITTCGSDCHGQFETSKIGQLQISIGELNLGDLYE